MHYIYVIRFNRFSVGIERISIFEIQLYLILNRLVYKLLGGTLVLLD